MEGKSSLLLVNNEDAFDKEVRKSKQVFIVVLTNGGTKAAPEIPVVVQPLLREFRELFPDELPTRLLRSVTFNTTLIWPLEPAYQTCHITR